MKLNFKDISIIYGVGTFTCVATASVAGALWQHWGGHPDYVTLIGGTWLVFVGGPSLTVARATVRQKLGERQPTSITAHGGKSSTGRAIPYTNGKQSGYVFFSQVRSLWSGAVSTVLDDDAPPTEDENILPQTFTVSVEGKSSTVTLPQLETFLRGVWRRQRLGKPGLSRNYWTKKRKPNKLSRLDYDALMTLILSVNGLVVDRQERRSGKILVPPQLSIKAIQGVFSLG